MAAVLTQSFGFTGNWQAVTGPSHSEHTHSEIELNLVEGACLPYLVAGVAIDFPPARWLAYWAALPHRVLARGQGCHLGWITIPMATVLTWSGSALTSRLYAGQVVALPQPDPLAAVRGRGWVEALRAPADDALAERRRRIATLELEALVLRLGLEGVSLGGVGSGSGTGRAGQGVSPAVEAMCRHLGGHYQEELRVADCAAAGGLSPAQAMAVFRRATGLTIGQYLCRLRLAHAQRLLLTTHEDVLAIALAAGFGSQARFYVAFRRAFGTTPAALRRAHPPADGR